MRLFLAGTTPKWVSNSFPVIEKICLVLLAILAVVLVILVFTQITGDSDNSNVITGNKESYYSQNKAGARAGRNTRLVYICIGAIAVISVIYYLLCKLA